MVTSSSDRAFLRSQFPEFVIRGLAGAELDQAIDAWFAHDHYDNNPVYSWNDESDCHA